MDKLKEVIKEIQLKYGDDIMLLTGDDIPEPFTERIPTGSIGLDCATGGGFPRGGLSQIVGNEGVGKTFMAFKSIIETQKKYGKDAKIAYASIEHPVDRKWAEKIGVTFDDRLTVLRATSGEHYLRAIKEFIDSNEFQLVIIDSIPAMVTIGQLEKQIGETAKVADMASLITNFVLSCIWGAKKGDGVMNLTCIMAINQFRSDIGGWSPHGPAKKQYGAWALKYAKLVDVELVGGSHITKGTGETKIMYGKNIRYRVAKGKAGCAEGGIGSFDFYNRYFPDEDLHPGQLDEAKEYRVVGVRENVIVRAGRYFKYKDEQYTKDDLTNKIRTDRLFKEKLRLDILKSVGVVT